MLRLLSMAKNVLNGTYKFRVLQFAARFFALLIGDRALAGCQKGSKGTYHVS